MTNDDASTPRVGQIALSWWGGMTSDKPTFTFGSRKSALSQLRRSKEPIDALLVPEAVQFYSNLRDAGHELSAERTMMIAMVLADVKTHTDKKLGDLMRSPKLGSNPDPEKEKENRSISPSAFRRFVMREEHEVVDAFRRLLDRFGNQVSVPDVATLIAYWGSDLTTKNLTLTYAGVYRSKAPIIAA